MTGLKRTKLEKAGNSPAIGTAKMVPPSVSTIRLKKTTFEVDPLMCKKEAETKATDWVNNHKAGEHWTFAFKWGRKDGTSFASFIPDGSPIASPAIDMWGL